MYYPYQQEHHQPPKQSLPPPVRQKLKCLVLGAAGAGKTSILRRHFRQVFEQGTRVPTLGSDFYTGRMSIPIETASSKKKKRQRNARDHGQDEAEEQADPEGQNVWTKDNTTHDDGDDENEHEIEEEEVTVNIQMWDTPGRERYYMEKQQQQHHHNHNHRSLVAASLSDSFFRNVSAIMLVYDMTSSTSFTQLLRWYADLMEMKHHHHHHHNGAAPEMCSFPILIVGNKLDILNSKILRHSINNNNNNDDSSASGGTSSGRQQQRDVMGLKGEFRGHDFRYEYCATAALEQQPQPLISKKNNNNYSRRRHYDYDNSSSRSRSKTTPSVMKIYSSALCGNDDKFTNNNNRNPTTHDEQQYMNMDGSYLNSLLNSEDESHPDRDLVILWCTRNGLQHMQVSAATGEGVEEAMKMLVRLALENNKKEKQQQQQQQAALTAATQQQQQQQHYIEQSSLTPINPATDTTMNAAATTTIDTTTSTSADEAPTENTTTTLNNTSNGTGVPRDNGNHHIIVAPSAPSASSPSSLSNINNNNNNPYQIQRRYPKLDLRERYASKEDPYKCFSCFLVRRFVLQWFRDR